MPQYGGDLELVIVAITKAVVCVIIVGSVSYCMVTGRELTEGYLQVILLVVGAYFGVSANLYRNARRERREVWGLLAAALEQLSSRYRRDVGGYMHDG